MSEIKNTNYNKMAPYYNAITNIISEGGNIRSQRYFLQYVKKTDEVLNIGCGSVQFNSDIARHCNNVVSIDIAEKMIQIAKENLKKKNLDKKVIFVCKDIMKYKTEKKYDVIFANFILNTFEWKNVPEVLSHICSLLEDGGILCIADEHIASKFWPRISQSLFRPGVSFLHHVWAGHPMHKVYNYESVLNDLGLERVYYEIDKADVVESSVYRMKEHR